MLACVTAMTLASGKAYAQNQDIYQSFIEVTGFAEKEVAPDIFYVNITINEADSKGKKSLAQQEKSMVAELKSAGIDIEKQLSRESLSSSFYNRRTNMARATYRLKLNSAEQVSEALDRLDALGISNVSFSKAEYSRIDEFKDEARKAAVTDAKRQATSMAGALGQKLGKCFYLYSGNSGNSSYYSRPIMAKAAVMANSMDGVEEERAEIDFDKIKVSVSVSAKFILE